jgi:hypothetical protein
MTSEDILFWKPPYEVYPSGDIHVDYAGSIYTKGYVVRNTETDTEEFRSPSLPDCISHSMQSAAGLKYFEGREGEEVIADSIFEAAEDG